jgi:hypothetical protein
MLWWLFAFQMKKAKRKPKRKRVFRLSKADRELLAEQRALEKHYAKRKPKRRRAFIDVLREVARADTPKTVDRLRRVVSEVAKAEGSRFRTIQSGPILIPRKGYYVTITALIPSNWATSSTPVFEPDKRSEQFHLAIWRTRVKATLQESLLDYEQLLIEQNAYSEIMELEYLILSGEMNELSEDHFSNSIAIWQEKKVPKWLIKAAKQQSKR